LLTIFSQFAQQVGLGIRRIEAIAGLAAAAWYEDQHAYINTIAQRLKVDNNNSDMHFNDTLLVEGFAAPSCRSCTEIAG